MPMASATSTLACLSSTNPSDDNPMADIRYLPTARETSARLLERVVSEAIARHPDPGVARRWARMARESVARWPGPPLPSHPRLDFDSGGALDAERRARLMEAADRWMESYFGDVRDQMMEMHGEMLALQRRIAEYELAAEEFADD